MTQPGPTLADCTGARRLRKLEDSILNLQCQVLEKLEQIDTMQHEIRELQNPVPIPQEDRLKDPCLTCGCPQEIRDRDGDKPCVRCYHRNMYDQQRQRNTLTMAQEAERIREGA